jgi:hypothetical protein
VSLWLTTEIIFQKRTGGTLVMGRGQLVKNLIFNEVLPLAAGAVIFYLYSSSMGNLTNLFIAMVLMVAIGFWKSPFLLGGNSTGFALSLILCVLIGWVFTLIWIVKGIALTFVYAIKLITYKEVE